MRQDNVNEILTDTVNSTFASVAVFIPKFVSGLIILLLGVILGAFLRQLILELFKIVKLEAFLKRYGVPETREGITWSNILAELLRWFVIFLFMVAAADIWGLSGFVQVLNRLLNFLPNLFIAVLLLLVGFVVSRLVYDLLVASLHGLSKDAAQTLANVGRWSVMVFVILAVLSQLNIAADLVRILFAGFVAMVALAGGLAFGLGGKDVARELLDRLKKKI